MEMGWLALLPAVVAVGLALWTRQVLVSLGGAVILGGVLIAGGNPLAGLDIAVRKLLVGALASSDHAKIIVFSVLVGALVELLMRTGATASLVGGLMRFAKGRRSGQVTSWLSGLLIFFDDYANCLIVGSSLRPLVDKLRISRAKLAYLVDSTAAPVASLALVSTFVGYEVGVIDQGLKKAGLALDPYAFFIEGWPLRFYPILAIVMVGLIATTGRDFGPMRAAEAAAGQSGDPGENDDDQGQSNAEAAQDRPAPGWVAGLSIAVLIGVTLGSLLWDGFQATPAGSPLFKVLGAADGYDAMLRASAAALAVGVSALFITRHAYGSPVRSFAERVRAMSTFIDAMLDGAKMLLEAIVVLLLAWALGDAMGQLKAADVLIGALGPSLPLWLLPTLVFLIGAAISFATGTSFGTMAILMPMVIPLAHGMGGDHAALLAASASVLAGACFGDHCSPISDTTVLSSAGAGADVVEHVRTQLPYALSVGGVSIVCGTLPAGFGVSGWLGLLVGAAALVGIVLTFGKTPDSASA